MAARRTAIAAAPRAYHHGNLRQELLDAAMRVFGQRGTLDFTLRELAREVGVTHNAPYRHFAGKEELLQALRDEGFRRLAEAEHAALRALGAGASGRKRVVALGEAYLRFAIAEPQYFHLVLSAPLEPGEPRQAETESYAVLERTLEECRVAGEARSDLGARELALAAWSLVHGLSGLVSSRRLPSDERRIQGYVAIMEAVFFDGAAAGTAATRHDRARARPRSKR